MSVGMLGGYDNEEVISWLNNWWLKDSKAVIQDVGMPMWNHLIRNIIVDSILIKLCIINRIEIIHPNTKQRSIFSNFTTGISQLAFTFKSLKRLVKFEKFASILNLDAP